MKYTKFTITVSFKGKEPITREKIYPKGRSRAMDLIKSDLPFDNEFFAKLYRSGMATYTDENETSFTINMSEGES